MTRFSLICLLTVSAVLPADAQDMPLSQVLIPGEGWKAIPGKYTAVTAAPDGSILVADAETLTIHRLHGPDAVKSLGRTTAPVLGLVVSADGTIYASQPEGKRVVRFTADGKEETFRSGHAFTFLALSPAGQLYATAAHSGDVYLLDPEKKMPEVVASGLKNPTGILFTPDGGTAVLGEEEGGFLWAFGVNSKNQQLTHPDRYFYPVRRVMEGDGGPLRAGTMGLTQDKSGRFYAATAAGVQVFDPTGRPCGVLTQAGEGRPSTLALGGPDGKTLFLLQGETLFARKTLAQMVGKVEKPK